MIRVEYVDHMGHDKRIVDAARISFDNDTIDFKSEKESEEFKKLIDACSLENYNIRLIRTPKVSESDIKLIGYLAKNEHMSPFEHNQLSVIIHCPLYIRSQIHRHRTFAYNEISRRYTSENLEFYYPDKLRVQDTKNKQGSELEVDEFTNSIALQNMKRVQEDALRLYNEMIGNGIARELARSILPQNLMTRFIMTGNLRNWSHFVRLRIDKHAQQEVQLIGNQIKTIIEERFPVAYKALNKYRLGNVT